MCIQVTVRGGVEGAGASGSVGAGVRSDRVGLGVQHVCVVDHPGPLAHVPAEQVLVPTSLQVVSERLVAGPVDPAPWT